MLRTDIAREPEWSQAQTLDLIAQRGDDEVLDEIADVLRAGRAPIADDVARIAQLVQLTGREVGIANTAPPADAT